MKEENGGDLLVAVQSEINRRNLMGTEVGGDMEIEIINASGFASTLARSHQAAPTISRDILRLQKLRNERFDL
jgi:hypothetical protein